MLVRKKHINVQCELEGEHNLVYDLVEFERVNQSFLNYKDAYVDQGQALHLAY